MKRRIPRRPFVITVALAVTACGGSVVGAHAGTGGVSGTGGASGTGGTSGSGGTSGNGGSGGSVGPGCPAFAPKIGTPCSDPSASCNYGPCDSLTCVGGTWETMAGGCNPPPPPPLCPTTLPANGTPCTTDGMQCSYPSDPNTCCPPAEAKCVSGVWQTTTSSCNRPPPTCPTAPPMNGASCATNDPCAVSMYICSWGSCGSMPQTVGQCNGKVWSVTLNCSYADAGAGP